MRISLPAPICAATKTPFSAVSKTCTRISQFSRNGPVSAPRH
jgi:hypothetical protein